MTDGVLSQAEIVAREYVIPAIVAREYGIPAIVAREYGIPAVVATGIATTTIADGSIVSVDGGRGVVTLEGDRKAMTETASARRA